MKEWSGNAMPDKVTHAHAPYGMVKQVSTRGYRRIFAVSDLHGNGGLLERLLKELHFCDEDALFMLGDYIEKGENSLHAVRLAMSLCEKGNAFALQGNCDTLWQDLKNNLYHVDLNGYVDWRKNSILADMCKELGIDRHAMGSDAVEKALEKSYGNIFQWLGGLPQIIRTEEFIYVHAGLDQGPLEEQNADRCLYREAFLEEDVRFDQYVVVGHMPLANYFFITGNQLSYQPIIDEKRKIIAIDGGSGVKSVGQLNVLVYEGGMFSSYSADDLPKARVLAPQQESTAFASIAWNHNEVELLRQEGDRAFCRHVFTDQRILIPNELLFEKRGTLCSYDYTTYRPALRTGETVSVLDEYGEDTMIKHKGVIGWAKTRNLSNQFTHR